MARPYPDISLVKSLLRYDPCTGKLYWKVDTRGANRNGAEAGGSHKRYKFVGVKMTRIAAHHIVWMFEHGSWPTGVIDHIDGNGMNNHISNLRDCTQSQNLANQRLSRANTSGIKGVSWVPKKHKWQVGIKVNGKRIGLGYFSDKEEAGQVYAKAAKHYFGDFARYAVAADAA